jgi:hypothetical protein
MVVDTLLGYMVVARIDGKCDHISYGTSSPLL